MGSPENKASVTVEDLIRIKRCELPDPKFWDDFEIGLQRRRLQVLVRGEQVRSVLWPSLMRFAAAAVPVILIAGFAWINQTNSIATMGEEVVPHVASLDAPSDTLVSGASRVVSDADLREVETTMSTGGFRSGISQFAMDVLPVSSSAAATFNKVLYTPALQMPNTPGNHYVRDAFASGEYRVTTSDIRLGRNF